MASVELRNLGKRFSDGSQPVRGFDLTIEDGELVVLVGSSGCGKTTLLRMLAGLETVSEGEIRIDGKRVNEATPQQRNIAMVFQNYALYPHMTVRANLEFPLRMARTPRNEIGIKVSEIAAILQLSELLERKPGQLSGGQRQRVAMGRALVRDPSLFLLDEPLSNLDAALRAQIREQIAQIQKRLGTTTLYVTHDQVEAMTLGDRVVVLDQGRIQQTGTPLELYRQPHNIFVARFIGNPGMNILKAGLEDRGGEGLAVRLGAQQLRLDLEPQACERLGRYAGQTLYVGIRPEALKPVPDRTTARLQAGVESCEFLGYESLARLCLPGTEGSHGRQTLTARLHGMFQPPVAGAADFYIRPGALYFFSSDGRNILA